jgi:hypothetical protein
MDTDVLHRHIQLPLALSPEFRLYNAFNTYRLPESSVPGQGLGAFYARGSGIPLNGRYYRQIDFEGAAGSGFWDSLKSGAQKALSFAKTHALPVLKQGLKVVGKNALKNTLQNLPELFDAAKRGGAKELFGTIGSKILPDVVADSVYDIVAGDEPKSGSGMGDVAKVNKVAMRHSIKLAIMNTIPLVMHYGKPIQDKLLALEKAAKAYKANDEKRLYSALKEFQSLSSMAVEHDDEVLDMLLKMTESLVDLTLWHSMEAVNPTHVEEEGTFDAKGSSGGFLSFLPALSGLISPIANAVAPLLGKIPVAGPALQSLAQGIGGVFGGSGLDVYPSDKQRRAITRAQNMGLLISINPAMNSHLRNGNMCMFFPGLAHHGMTIDLDDILSNPHLHHYIKTSRRKLAHKPSKSTPATGKRRKAMISAKPNAKKMK